MAVSAPSSLSRHFNWRLFWLLCGLVFIGALLGVPYVSAAQNALAKARNTPPIPSFVTLAGLIVNAFLYVPLIALGMLASERASLLGAPLLTDLTQGTVTKRQAKVSFVAGVKVGVIVGIGGAILTIISQPWIKQYFVEHTGKEWPSIGTPSPWQGLLGAVYAAISEEIVFRFFLLSTVAWFVGRLWRTRQGSPQRGIFWVSNVISALIFGTWHLFVAAQLELMLLPVIAQVVLLNGILGLSFGWLYWRYGLESAMVGHFAAGVIIHVIAPVLTPM